MDHTKRNQFIQTFNAKLLLNDMQRGALRRELATPFTSVDRRNVIHESISILTRQYELTKSKLQWVQAEERLGRDSQPYSSQFVTHLIHTDD